ncbi:DUF6318 family protein [Rothia mucilaginosa]|uniref:DUF6318 family protein n=1 Tax=Rothia mucilaginosa TaxID=43675 RepID=UPI0028EDF4C3|nr:DUF6318 family protein [Rothia mucilaginosa]
MIFPSSRRGFIKGALGAGGVLALSACSSTPKTKENKLKETPSATASASPKHNAYAKSFHNDRDYRRTYEIGDINNIGIYEPATEAHPAYAAPPPYYNSTYERNMTASSMNIAVTYYANYQNYMLLSGDSRRLHLENMLGGLFFPTIQELYDNASGWVITPNQRILNFKILEPQPRIVDEANHLCEINVRYDLKPEAKVFITAEKKLYPITDFDTRNLVTGGSIYGTMVCRFLDPKWEVNFTPTYGPVQGN